LAQAWSFGLAGETGREETIRELSFQFRDRAPNILQPDKLLDAHDRLPTVGVRMNRQSKNAHRIAETLHGHPKIDCVIYPTLLGDPDQVANCVPKRLQKRLSAPRYPTDNKGTPGATSALLAEGL